MGRKYAETINRLSGNRVTAVCTSKPESVKLSGVCEEAAIFSSYEEMLSCSDFDVVCLTVPTHLHYSYTLQAAAARKHVICEKPIALRPEDARDMISACDKYGVGLFVGHVLRFFPAYKHLRELVLNGQIGAVRSATAKRASVCPKANSWFSDHTQSGGVILDLMIHDIDFMRWTLGDVQSVYAFSRCADGVEYASATLHFMSEAIAQLEAHWGYPDEFLTQVELVGENGRLRNDNRSTRPFVLRKSQTQQMNSRGVVLPKATVGNDPFQEEIQHFLQCIRDRRTPIVTAKDAARALEIAAAAAKSAQLGKPVRLFNDSRERT